LRISLRILVAVKSEGLSRVIFHLLATLQEVDMVCSVSDPSRLVHYAERVLPHLIIANACCVNSAETIAALKTASPGVKVILTLWEDANCNVSRLRGADARLSENTLVDQLVPTVRKLSAHTGHTSSSRTARRSFQ
jgi:DNA-binding NarL/FixJ family response regulator